MPSSIVCVSLTIAQRAELLVTQKLEAEKSLAEAKEGLEALVIENDGEPIIAGENKVTLSSMPGRATLTKEKLVECGVATDIIEKATRRGDDYMVLNVRKASKADLKKEAA